AGLPPASPGSGRARRPCSPSAGEARQRPRRFRSRHQAPYRSPRPRRGRQGIAVTAGPGRRREPRRSGRTSARAGRRASARRRPLPQGRVYAGAVSLSEDVGRIAEVAAGFAAPGEEAAAVLPVEPACGERVYLCAIVQPDGAQSWLAFDDGGTPLTNRTLIRDAASIAALVEIAEESAAILPEAEPRLASPAYLDSLGAAVAARGRVACDREELGCYENRRDDCEEQKREARQPVGDQPGEGGGDRHRDGAAVEVSERHVARPHVDQPQEADADRRDHRDRQCGGESTWYPPAVPQETVRGCGVDQ